MKYKYIIVPGGYNNDLYCSLHYGKFYPEHHFSNKRDDFVYYSWAKIKKDGKPKYICCRCFWIVLKNIL